MNQWPTVYETVALPLSYTGNIKYWIFHIDLILWLKEFMSKIDPELKKKLLKESQSPFKGLRRILWIAFSGSAFLGLLIMLSRMASGTELQQNNLLIQLGACILFPTLLFFDRNKDWLIKIFFIELMFSFWEQIWMLL